MSGAHGLTYRADVDGLRAVAIVAVVLFHAGVDAFAGGFVGVDVFFVISGYLITGLMLAELDRTGGFSLGSFVARRVRRLLPMAALVITTTVAVGSWLVAPLARDRLFDDAAAALLYVANWRFADQSTAYTDTEVTDSLLLHYWSLSVEEQYYVLWPLLFALVVALVGRLAPPRTRSAVLVLLVAGVAGSFAASATSDASAGYYWTHLRLWEMGLGGLLAFALPRLPSPPRPVAAVAGAAGLGLIVTASLTVDATTRWPGTWALVPTLGTALVIASGVSGSPVHRVLGTRAPVAIGHASYGWYLWHWPAIGVAILWNERAGRPLAVGVAMAIAAVASLGLAMLTRSLVEEPIRHAPALLPRRRSFLLGVAAMALPLLAVWVAPTVVDTGADSVVRAAAAESLTPDATPTPGPASTGHALDGPLPDRPAGPFRMTPRDAADDRIPCGHLDWAGTRPEWCELGDPDGEILVAVVGDSHALNWQRALDGLASARSWRLISSTKSACAPYIGLPPQWNSGLEQPYDDCVAWAANTFDELEALEPDLVVLTHISFHAVGLLDETGERVDDTDPASLDLWEAAAEETFERLAAIADEVVVLLDTPRSVSIDDTGVRRDVDIPECLSANLADPSRCDFTVTDLAGLDRMADAARAAPVTVLDGAGIVCPGGVCRAVTPEGIVTYKDVHHLTDTYSAWLARDLAAALDAELAG